MYYHIRGELVELSPVRAVVEAAGVGYELSIPFSTFSAIKDKFDRKRSSPKNQVCLFTHLQVREDLLKLYGFSTERERVLFRTVTAVNGLGPAAALTILSSMEAEQFEELLDAGNPEPLQKIKGIGKKLASRLIVELKGHIQITPTSSVIPAFNGKGLPFPCEKAGGIYSEAILALVELGFQQKEAEKRVAVALERVSSRLVGEKNIEGKTPSFAEKRGGGSELMPGQNEGTVSAGMLTVESVLREALRLN